MNLVLTVLEIVAPVFLLAGAGYAWIRLGFEYRIQFVTRLAMTLAIPCLVFTSLMQSDIDPADLTQMSLAAAAGYGVLTVFAFVAVRVTRIETRTYMAPMIFGNTGNLGLPLALFAFGDQGLGYALVVFAISGIYGFTFGVWLVSGGGSLRNVLREPMVWAALLGALFLWQGWQTPLFVTRTLELVGQMAIPLMLLTLGVAVARLSPGRLGRAVWLSLLRLVLCLFAGWAVAAWFRLEPVALGVLLLQLATPVAVTSYMLAEKYGADSDAVAGLVVVSTVLAIVTLPLALGFLI
ncbi:MAG: AEC family transporter [Rhodobacteraceae bacterium]|nr:AEC family transporter [Paracoccaceae bacterium]